MWVKCDCCGNVYSSPPRNSGGRCGVNRCDGMLRPFAAMNMLQCDRCGNVYGGEGRRAGQECGVNRCQGRLAARSDLIRRR